MSIPVLSFCAYSGTGKTTLLAQVIASLTAMGVRVAAIKHDCHEFEIDKPGKDTWKMTQAGAKMTIITSATRAAIMENRPMDIDGLLGMVHDVDLVLTEGYKFGPWPKIGLCRLSAGKKLPEISGAFSAVVTDQPLELEVPQFSYEQAEELARFIARMIHWPD